MAACGCIHQIDTLVGADSLCGHRVHKFGAIFAVYLQCLVPELAGLPAKVHKLLSRFGTLQGEPEIFDGGFDVSAVTAIACFETLEAAQAAC